MKKVLVKSKREYISQNAQIYTLAVDMSKIISNKETVIFKINFFNKIEKKIIRCILFLDECYSKTGTALLKVLQTNIT